MMRKVLSSTLKSEKPNFLRHYIKAQRVPAMTFTTETRRPTNITLESFLESPTSFPSINGYNGKREIFFVGEQHRLYEITDELNKIFRLTTFHGIVTAACYFTCPPLFSMIMMGSFAVPLYYTIKLYRMNKSIRMLASKLIWKMELTEDKNTVKIHTMLSNSIPSTIPIKNIEYLKYLDRESKEPEEEGISANDASVAIKINNQDDKNPEKIALYFLKIYFDSQGTVIPNAALLRSVIRGDEKEVQKYELNNKLDCENEMEEFIKNVTSNRSNQEDQHKSG